MKYEMKWVVKYKWNVPLFNGWMKWSKINEMHVQNCCTYFLVDYGF